MKKNWPIFLFLLFLILVTYSNSLNNDFLSDDLADIVNNPDIGNFSNIASRPFGFIRPLLYFIVFHIGELNEFLFRSINLSFHIGSVFLVFAIFTKLYSRRLGLIIASIFAVHPAISEPVVWISGGMYPQYTFFFLMSFLFYILSNNVKKYYWLSVISFWLAFMSHPQMPLSLFVIFPLYEICFGDIKKHWKKAIPYLLLALFYVALSILSIPQREATLNSIHYQEKGIDNIFLLIPVAFSSYFELIFFPKTLTLYHSELAFPPINFAIRVTLTLLFLGGILYCFKKNKYIFFWGSLFVIGLAPTLTPFRLNWIVAERYLYLPLVGILAIVGLGLEKLSHKIKPKEITYILFALIIISLSVRTIIRNIDWKSEDNLWVATGKTSPSSPNTHNNLGDVYGRQGDKEGALREFSRAVELKPNYGDAYHNLANTYRELGQMDKALENYENALKYNPGLWQSHQNIAAIYFANKQYDKAVENIQKAIQINPKNINLYNNLGIVYLNMDQKDKAKEIFTKVLNSDPQNQFAKQGLIEASK